LYTTDFGYVTSETKSILLWYTDAGCSVLKKIGIYPFVKAGFDKIDISILGLWCTYRFFPSDDTFAVLFWAMLSTVDHNLVKILLLIFVKNIFVL
jgi:hypothetical protein